MAEPQDAQGDRNYDAEPTTPVRQPSLLSDEALYKRLKDWFLKDSAHSEEWRDQARRDFDFVAGDQWEPDTFRRLVKDEKRVPITFNQTATFLKMIAGLEINSRHECIFLPRGTDEGQIIMNEALSQASRWMAQQCDAEDHESMAWRDMAICGMGWTESRIDYEMDKDGMYVEEQIDPVEMYWDKNARRKNIQDSQRVFRARKMRLEEARALAESLGVQDVQDEDLDASWAIGVDQKAVKPYEEIRLKQGPGNAVQEGIFEGDPNQEVHIVQVQWWEREVYHRVRHPNTGQEIQLYDDEFQQLIKAAKQANQRIVSVRQTRKVYKQAFVGAKILWKGDCPAPDRFTFQCMTGELWRGKGTWFGIVRLLRDPQMWSNKLFSQVMHILNTTAKGGILAEKGAFPDIREAQKTYARPDAITIVEDGAIQRGRIMQKPGVGLAAPFLTMMDYSSKAFYTCTGLNIELMGMRDQEQPGVLEAQRKQAGMTVMATMFDARKTYLANIGRIRMHFIQNILADGRLMRVLGPDKKTYVAIRLLKDRVAGEYDVEVSDAPTSPDQKDKTWSMLMQLAPLLKGAMNPQLASIFLEYSPLPTKAVDELRQAMSTPDPNKQQMEQQQIAGTQAKIEDLRAQSQERVARTAQIEAQTDKTQADTSKVLADAILDLAQAGGHMAADKAAAVEDAILAMVMRRMSQPMTMFGDAYAVQPGGTQGPGALPQLPQVPMLGQGGPPPPAIPNMGQILANASARAAAAQSASAGTSAGA